MLSNIQQKSNLRLRAIRAISLLALVAGLNLTPAEAELNVLCVDHTVDGYYPTKNAIFSPGMPNDNFIARPATISKCELEKIHTDCVERINEYRSGLRTFKGTDSTGDAAAGAPNGDPDAITGINPVKELTAGNVCSSRQAMGDLVVNVNGGGGCAGGHHTWGTCPWSTSLGQNACCASGINGKNISREKTMNTYDNVKEALFHCLQRMWDEGEITWTEDKGHYETMISDKYEYVSCGFAFNAEGRAMMNQDFTAIVPEPYKTTPCTCVGANAGNSSNCPVEFGGAGRCDPCEEPESSSSVTCPTSTTSTPTVRPTDSPTPVPTTSTPTARPTDSPTPAPTRVPTSTPTARPTDSPTLVPTTSTTTVRPTGSPTLAPTTSTPTVRLTGSPTLVPTTSSPTARPTDSPTPAPTRVPTSSPTARLTDSPTRVPEDCTEDPEANFIVKRKGNVKDLNKNCEWLTKRSKKKKDNFCKTKKGTKQLKIPKVSCPVTCEICDPGEDEDEDE